MTKKDKIDGNGIKKDGSEIDTMAFKSHVDRIGKEGNTLSDILKMI